MSSVIEFSFGFSMSHITTSVVNMSPDLPGNALQVYSVLHDEIVYLLCMYSCTSLKKINMVHAMYIRLYNIYDAIF